MTAPPSPDPSDSYVPYARRRNTPAQLNALQNLFDATPHPTRPQRQALANEFGLELKSVTNWFQNRRQTRKKSLSVNENNPTKARLLHSPPGHRHRRSKTPLDRSKISLDRIAALSERPNLTFEPNSHRPPLTPRKSNVQLRNPSSPSELWTHMLSSPVVPPTSPDIGEARLAALSSRAKMLFPLDWACLKARQRRWVDEDADESSMPQAPTRCRGTDEEQVEPVVVNLETSATISLDDDASSLDRHVSSFSRPNLAPQLEEVEAAITLLGFKMRS